MVFCCWGEVKHTQPVVRAWQAAWARPMAKAETRRLVIENFMFASSLVLSCCIR